MCSSDWASQNPLPVGVGRFVNDLYQTGSRGMVAEAFRGVARTCVGGRAARDGRAEPRVPRGGGFTPTLPATVGEDCGSTDRWSLPAPPPPAGRRREPPRSDRAVGACLVAYAGETRDISAGWQLTDRPPRRIEWAVTVPGRPARAVERRAATGLGSSRAPGRHATTGHRQVVVATGAVRSTPRGSGARRTL